MRFYRKLAILAKIETTYGTDAVPTGAANAMQAKNVTIQPIQGDQVSHDFLLPYLGSQGVELTGNYVQIEGEIEMAGAGAAGDAPAYGPLLRACGFSETITAGTDVQYDPVSGSFEAVSIYFNQDGVRHVALGSRGNVVMSLVPKQIPTFKFTMMGLLGTITDQALPTVDLTAFTLGRAVNKARTTLSLNAVAQIAESISIDAGMKVETRHLIGYEGIEITDRQASGTIVVQATDLATNDWFTMAQARTRVPFDIVHGTVAGDIVELSGPTAEIGRPTQGQTQGIVNYSIPLMLVPDAGNDELKITVK